MTEYRTHPRHPTRKEVEAALSTLDFPLDKEDLVRCVTEQTGDDDAVVRQLRALPLATYGSADEVLRSVEFDGSGS
jgi:hypothetical protein